jgi:YD repeat-containing protein
VDVGRARQGADRDRHRPARSRRYSYDKLGRRIKEEVDPGGVNIIRSWTYDKNGNALTRHRRRGQLTRFAYDSLDRLVYSVDACRRHAA